MFDCILGKEFNAEGKINIADALRTAKLSKSLFQDFIPTFMSTLNYLKLSYEVFFLPNTFFSPDYYLAVQRMEKRQSWCKLKINYWIVSN